MRFAAIGVAPKIDRYGRRTDGPDRELIDARSTSRHAQLWSVMNRPLAPEVDRHVLARRVGAILMTLGALFLGFIAFQLWGTGLEHANAQRKLRAEFEQELAETRRSAVTTTTAPTSSTTPPTALHPPTLPPTTAGSAAAPTTVGTPTAPLTAAPTTAGVAPAPPTAAPTTAPPATEPPPTLPPRPVLAPGDPVLWLEIPKIGVDEIVVEGVGVDELKQGPGHYSQTPLPGEPGNAAIAGHRTTYGGPFSRIDELDPGDEIVVTTYAGRYVYRVEGTVIVAPSEVWVVSGTPDVRLTLTSCHPKYSAAQRIAVSAVLDAEASSPLATIPPATEAPPPTEASATDPTTAPAESAAPSDVPVVGAEIAPTTPPVSPTETAAANTAPVTSPSPSTPPAGSRVPLGDVFGPGEPGGGDGGGGDAGAGGAAASPAPGLRTGWFDDGGAAVQTLLWGAACAAIALAARFGIRRLGHRFALITAAALPFAAALFYFYANLNRVVPAGA